MMTRFRTALVAVMALLCAPALVSVTTASADAPGGPVTWQVLVGGQSQDQAVQAEGYYPHVITIDAGDTVVWTLNTPELHGVVFAGTCNDFSPSCVPPDCLAVVKDFSPCGPSSFDGVIALSQSGRMVAPVYNNWDNSVPHGTTTYSLTFTRPGINVYWDPSVSGMRGVVIVHPAGTPYPLTQAQYSRQAQRQLRADLAAGAEARRDAQPVTVSARPGGTRTYQVALSASPQETARVELDPASGSAARGRAYLEGQGIGPSPAPSIAVTVKLSGLVPGSVHAAQILLGVCGAPAPTAGLWFDMTFPYPTFTLNNLTAGPDGTATSTTAVTQPLTVIGGPGQLAIPSSGWFINVAAGPAPDHGQTSAACGNVVFHSAAVMRYIPRRVHIHVGDTVVWTNDTTNEPHAVTFLAGQPLPQIPEWFQSSSTGNGISYGGSSYFNSGELYRADIGQAHSLTLTFTRPGAFPYVDVGDFFMEMQGSVVVTPP
jgi:plastocyanin